MINVEEFTKLLEKEFEEIEESTLSPTTNYREIPEFSSMHVLIIIAFIDNEFDILLTGQDLKNAQTIEDLYHLIHQRLNEQN